MAPGKVNKRVRRPVPSAVAGAAPAPPAGAALSAERAALAAAVAGLREHSARLTATEAALNQVQERVYAAGGRRHEAAEAAVAKAKTEAVSHLIDVAAGRAGEAPMTVRDARRRAEDASDELGDAARRVGRAGGRAARTAGRQDLPRHGRPAGCRRGARGHPRSWPNSSSASSSGSVSSSTPGRRWRGCSVEPKALCPRRSPVRLGARWAGLRRSRGTWRFAVHVPGAGAMEGRIRPAAGRSERPGRPVGTIIIET